MSPRMRNDKLPPYVYKRKAGYELRIYAGKNEPMRAVKLCPADSTISDVWKFYEAIHINDNLQTLSWLMRKYLASDQFSKKAEKTRTGTQEMVERICNYKMTNGKKFGGVELKQITSGAIRKYLDARARDNAPVSGNRETSQISAAWNWSLERDIIKLPNPIQVVSRNKESHRTRYVTQEEYNAVYAIASYYVKQAMELAYLCRLRRGEILGATRSQILPEGFDTLRTKGSRDTITLWSDRLLKAVKPADGIASVYIVHNQSGQPITETAFKSAWTRLKKKMIKLRIEPFNFHDLKAMGISNTEDNDKLKASGHRDAKMLKVYDRKKPVVDATK
jgi:integrase